MLSFRRTQLIIVFAASAVLSACSGLGGTFSVDRFLYKDISGDTTGACMARSYQAWARHKAWVQVNYAGAAELAQRGEAARAEWDATALRCAGPDANAHRLRMSQFLTIAQNDPARACSCGNALVELERWACAGLADDKGALTRRFEGAAAACEGR